MAGGAGHAHDLPARTVTCHRGAGRGKSGLLVAVEHAIEIAIQGQPVTIPLGDTGIGHGTVRMGRARSCASVKGCWFALLRK